MARPTVLIAAFCGRSLAQSAHRAGFDPLVADAFGDLDTLACAQSSVVLKSALGCGFKRKSLTRALRKLSEQSRTPPVGLVLGPGFEDNSELIGELAGEFTLLGNSGKSVARCKDPAHLFALLRDLGIPHPETSLSPPDDPSGWIVKRIGGSGGLHISACANPASTSVPESSYFQRAHTGTPLSIAGVVSKRGFAIGVCRQWLSPQPSRPYRFGGIVSPVEIDPDTEARMIEVAVELTGALDLQGFVSFDFLITETDILLLEVNPRPTVALDVLDGRDGHIFKAHMAAVSGFDPTEIVAPRSGGSSSERGEGVQAIGYLYADFGPVEINRVDWPAWACDRPSPGNKIARHRPLASVKACGSCDKEAEELCRERLGELENLLYGERP